MSAQRYRVAGLALDSDIVLPGVAPRDTGSPELRVVRAPLVAAVTGWSVESNVVTLDAPGIVRMQAIGGRELRVAGADAAAFVAGTGIGMLLHQRAEVVLRGAAIEREDGAALFIGPSVGKSTLAMALARRGYALIADDLCRVTIDGGASIVPSGVTGQLRRAAIDRLGLAPLGPVRPGIDRFHVEPPARAAGPSVLREVFVLRSSDAAHPDAIVSMSPLQASVALYAAAYRPALVAALGQQALYFDAAAAIVRHAPVHRLTMSRALDDTLGRIERHWAAP